MRAICVFASALAPCANYQAFAWGALGHRITGSIANENLSGVARANVRVLLGNEDLAEAATWPDEMKSDPAPFWQTAANPWHYVTVRHSHECPSSEHLAQLAV